MRRLSIIVPLLNERNLIAELAKQLQPWQQRHDCEVILVDGGSGDGTAQLARDAGLRVLVSPRGRARQMNCGAASARGEILLFLHGDTQLPVNALELIEDALAEKYRWGRFDVRIAGRSFWFPLIATLINWRSRLSGIATGDQAIFVHRREFEQLGGFPEQPLMEDIELSRRLLKISRPACIGVPVSTSGRRWQSRGVLRTVLLMWRLRFAYWRGVPAETLARRYE
ncbi:TIGR04283 family arsenosugar biosynthesis glycosyltransferase [Microbulbifer sp.]|uniref:TIGR04283 family arsenosugar biosynthesis glycosyltransferase n=1 Tax=Microbulbifer sp. TaxID=1908541 RepID=UPI003F39D267